MRTALLSSAFVLLTSLSVSAQADQTWIDLDGTDDFLDLGTDAIIAGRSTFTVEMRMHFDSSEGEYTIIGQRTSDANRTFVIQRWSGALYILFDGSNYASCAFAPCASEEYMLSVVYDGSGAANSDRLQCYLNGAPQTLAFTGTIPATTLVTSPAADLVLGCEHNGPDTQLQFLDGQFGEVRFWDHALSAAEISGGLGAETAGTEPGLTEYFHFADGVPAGDNTAITSFAGGNGVSTITPMHLAMTGAGSNFEGAPALAGAIDVSVTVTGHVIAANLMGATYQWLDCDNNFAHIPSAVSRSYAALSDGSYAVQITEGACSDTSECVEIITAGIATQGADRRNMYPNPATNELIVELGVTRTSLPFAILDPRGRVVRNGSVIGKAIIPVADLAPGVYLLQLGTGGARSVKVFEKD